MSPHPVHRPDASTDAPIRVVLCDDVQAFRALMRFSLEDYEGIEVVGEAGDGREGVRRVGELQPDVVLLDLSMPECDGLEAIPQMLSCAPGTSIVALSSFASERMAGTVVERGAWGYLEKGVEVRQIVDAIRDAAHRDAAV